VKYRTGYVLATGRMVAVPWVSEDGLMIWRFPGGASWGDDFTESGVTYRRLDARWLAWLARKARRSTPEPTFRDRMALVWASACAAFGEEKAQVYATTLPPGDYLEPIPPQTRGGYGSSPGGGPSRRALPRISTVFSRDSNGSGVKNGV
jgi:hypothetical protein